MTDRTDLDQLLDRWMDEGPTSVAERVISAAVTQVPTTRQRGAHRALRGTLRMFMTPAATVAAIALVAVLGIAAYRLIAGSEPWVGAEVDSSGPEARDVAEIVVTDETVPEGWEATATLSGRDALAHLIHYGEVRDAARNLVDARATDFCTAGQQCGTSWVAVYGADADADAAFSFFHGEMQVGWGMGTSAEALDFEEDDGYAYRNNMGGTHRQAYVWRQGSLVMGVLGPLEHKDALRSAAEGMDARSH